MRENELNACSCCIYRNLRKVQENTSNELEVSNGRNKMDSLRNSIDTKLEIYAYIDC